MRWRHTVHLLRYPKVRMTIFGFWYVGLVKGACLAEAGNHVVCVSMSMSARSKG